MSLHRQAAIASGVLACALMAFVPISRPNVSARAAEPREGDDAAQAAQMRNEVMVVLEDHVAELEKIFNRVHALGQVDAVGGEDDTYERIAGKLSAARVEVAAARGVPLGDDDISIAEAHVTVLERMFKKVKTWHEIGVRGGEGEKYERLAAKLYAARAQVAATQDIKQAIDLQDHACNHAAASVEAHHAAYLAGTSTLADLIEAHELQKQCSLALIRWKQTQRK